MNQPPIASRTVPRRSGAVLDQVRPDRGANVDERRADREHGADEQPDRDRDLESGVLLGEEDPGRSERMEPEKAAGRHERQRNRRTRASPRRSAASPAA